MAVPTKSFTLIADASIDPDSPITTSLMNSLRDNDVHLEEWLGLSFVAEQDHNHDGINSKIIEGGFLFGDNAVDNTTRTTTSATFSDVSGTTITIAASDLPTDRLVHTLVSIRMSGTISGDGEVRLSVDGVIRGALFVETAGTLTRFGLGDSFLLFSGTTPVIKLQFRNALVGQTTTVDKSHVIVKLAE